MQCHTSHVNFALGIWVVLLWAGPSLWIQCRRPFLWSRLVGTCAKFKVPSQARDDSNSFSTLTICQNSGLFSGWTDQQCSISACSAPGEPFGTVGLKFCTKKKHNRLQAKKHAIVSSSYVNTCTTITPSNQVTKWWKYTAGLVIIGTLARGMKAHNLY